MDTDNLDYYVENLAQLRADREDAANAMAAAQEALSATPEAVALSDATDRWQAAKRLAELADEQLRTFAINCYLQDGNAHAHPAVSIINKHNPNFEEVAAVAYCVKSESTHLLKLDKTAFVKMARANEKHPALRFIEWTDEPAVRVATDLTQYLEDGNE